MYKEYYIIAENQKFTFKTDNEERKIPDKKLENYIDEKYNVQFRELLSHDLSNGMPCFVPKSDVNGVTIFIPIYGEKLFVENPVKIKDGKYYITKDDKKIEIEIKDNKTDLGQIENPFYDYYCIILDKKEDEMIGYTMNQM